MLTHERLSAGAAGLGRRNPGEEETFAPQTGASHTPSRAAGDAAAIEARIDGDGWEYIDLMLSRLMKG